MTALALVREELHISASAIRLVIGARSASERPQLLPAGLPAIITQIRTFASGDSEAFDVLSAAAK